MRQRYIGMTKTSSVLWNICVYGASDASEQEHSHEGRAGDLFSDAQLIQIQKAIPYRLRGFSVNYSLSIGCSDGTITQLLQDRRGLVSVEYRVPKNYYRGKPRSARIESANIGWVRGLALNSHGSQQTLECRLHEDWLSDASEYAGAPWKRRPFGLIDPKLGGGCK